MGRRILPRALPAPLHLTVMVTAACPLSCAACSRTEPTPDELTPARAEALVGSLRRPPLWLTLTGGEPTVRADLPALIHALGRACAGKTRAVTLCSSGVHPERLEAAARALLDGFPAARVGVNLSLDGDGPTHEALRGWPGLMTLVRESARRLRGLDSPRLVLGINTLVQPGTARAMPSITALVRALGADIHLLEPLAERWELGPPTRAPRPSGHDLRRAAAALLIPRLTPGALALFGLRRLYYRHAAAVLDGTAPPRPCLAGRAFAHLASDGELWPCAVLARTLPLGRTGPSDNDLHRVWHSPSAEAARDRLASGLGACERCTLASAFYLNLWGPLLLLAGSRL